MTIGEKQRLIKVSGEPEALPGDMFADNVVSEAVLRDKLKGMEMSTVYWQSADHVTFGVYANGGFSFSEYEPQWQHLQELRVFNLSSELHIWRYGKTYCGRFRKDETPLESAKENCLEQTVKLWGTYAKRADKFIVLCEDRGMELAIPCKWEQRFEQGINPFLRERLYLKEGIDGCVYIDDRRFCCILLASNSSGQKVFLQKIEVNV